ncbi:SRPBCC family protein [Mucilaginibacter sp. McL0603]|uniref:SRPBCC family protein n=1 Tax=Mucilaginibacter sp. McL0603 TaxID=3415670 RepID=UPI003CEBD019
MKAPSTKFNDEFIFCYGDGGNAHYSKQKLIEFIPSKKVVWLVTDSKINWIKNNKEEWTNTQMIFEISTKGDKTILHFTHEGLVPELECYSDCKQGWNMIIKEWLYNFITD